MAVTPKPRLTEEEYLAQERKTEFKSEYLNGEVFAMAGGTLCHARLITNFALISEVLSDSTRNYDLGRKFELYRFISTLREYVTVEQSAVHITTRQRQEDGS